MRGSSELTKPNAPANFVRIHKTLPVTPAMAAGVTDRLWQVADIAKLVEDAEARPVKRWRYKKRVERTQ
jgi:hypothetical protein